MKKLLYLFLLLILLLPIKIYALTEDEARKVLTDYSYYVYNNHSDKITYTSPSNVNQQQIFNGYYTNGNTYAMDCNAFMGFLLYNGFQINATENGSIPQPSKGNGVLTSSGRPALNGVDGWSTHSSFYDSKRYDLRGGETVQNAVSRIGLENLLKPGDMIGIVGYDSSSYPNQDTAKKNTHIMMYLGDGKFIHNKSTGISIDTLNNISFGNKVGSMFPDDRNNPGPHGSITVLKLQNYESLPTSLIGSYRFPNGNGELSINNQPQSNPNGNNNQVNNKGHYEDVEGIHFCENENTYRMILLLNAFLIIIRAVVPTILTISIMYTIYTAVIKNDDLKEPIKKSIMKAIAAIVAILITLLIPYTISKILNVSYDRCIEMSKDPKPSKVWVEDQTSYLVIPSNKDIKKDS